MWCTKCYKAERGQGYHFAKYLISLCDQHPLMQDVYNTLWTWCRSCVNVYGEEDANRFRRVRDEVARKPFTMEDFEEHLAEKWEKKEEAERAIRQRASVDPDVPVSLVEASRVTAEVEQAKRDADANELSAKRAEPVKTVMPKYQSFSSNSSSSSSSSAAPNPVASSLTLPGQDWYAKDMDQMFKSSSSSSSSSALCGPAPLRQFTTDCLNGKGDEKSKASRPVASHTILNGQSKRWGEMDDEEDMKHNEDVQHQFEQTGQAFERFGKQFDEQLKSMDTRGRSKEPVQLGSGSRSGSVSREAQNGDGPRHKPDPSRPWEYINESTKWAYGRCTFGNGKCRNDASMTPTTFAERGFDRMFCRHHVNVVFRSQSKGAK